MSRENVESALAAVDAVARMDLDALIELTDPEVEWHSFFAQLAEGGGTYRGHEGIRQYMSDVTDAWEVLSPQVKDTVAAGDVVVIVSELRHRGKGSGAEMVTPAGYMVKFREGRILHMRSFRDPATALEAVGLAE